MCIFCIDLAALAVALFAAVATLTSPSCARCDCSRVCVSVGVCVSVLTVYVRAELVCVCVWNVAVPINQINQENKQQLQQQQQLRIVSDPLNLYVLFLQNWRQSNRSFSSSCGEKNRSFCSRFRWVQQKKERKKRTTTNLIFSLISSSSPCSPLRHLWPACKCQSSQSSAAAAPALPPPPPLSPHVFVGFACRSCFVMAN